MTSKSSEFLVGISDCEILRHHNLGLDNIAMNPMIISKKCHYTGNMILLSILLLKNMQQ